MAELDSERDSILMDLAHIMHVRPWETDLLAIRDFKAMSSSIAMARKAASNGA